MLSTVRSLIVLLIASLYLSAQTVSVMPTVETTPVPSSGDAADDACLWVHPTNPALSVIIGTDKNSGLGVYDMNGVQRQFLSHGDMNNVDLRYNFLLGSTRVAIATAVNRSNGTLAAYAINPVTRMLYSITGSATSLVSSPYGSCMYQSRITGDTYFIVNSENGAVQQWRLGSAASGTTITATLVRSFSVGSQTEGCVCDDENGYLYIGEENVGIWRYGAEPGAGTSRIQIDSTGSGGHLSADVEGLAIYYTAGNGGYLMASSQGNNTYTIYRRTAPHTYLGTFQIVTNSALGIDGCSDTDGIEVINLNLGSTFPNGCFIAQDGSNTGGNQNYKLVPWQSIANAFSTPLQIDSTYDALGVHRTATAVSYGAGCGSLTLTPDPTGRPVLGQVASATINNVPSTITGIALGWNTQSVDLTGSGMPGCTLLQSNNILGLGTSVINPTTHSFSVNIPNLINIIGTHGYVQAYAFAPGMNPMQVIVSNGVDWTFGDF